MASNAFALIYHSSYNLELPGHVFPAHKYSHLYNRVKRDPVYASWDILLPKKAEDADLELVHTKEYLDDLFSYEHTSRTMYSELPLNRSIVESFTYGVGGTIMAAELSKKFQFAFNMGGGYHHSFPDRAEGFCYLNDVAIAIRKQRETDPNSNALIIDLDLHQGNGNSYIFQYDDKVYTFSMHQGNLYPKKEVSNLDVDLEPNTKDDEYLTALEKSLNQIRKDFDSNIIYYVAGADPYEDDSLGELKISMKGLKERDLMVRKFAETLNVPCVVTLAGGYARDFRDTVEIHFNTITAFGEK
ncbi:histone deacetylase family protein [Leptospira perdikensis]|uniref:Histone deacetylase n=1 Tax=Leptospira perdikensis TaxID=2484948 RepID=A0A4R9JM01_9LEPT|nr:histone deacetylase [Leptospira perdikensis]TGL44921.1 histone deacetylase [Leptospira perdikensis]